MNGDLEPEPTDAVTLYCDSSKQCMGTAGYMSIMYIEPVSTWVQLHQAGLKRAPTKHDEGREN